MFDNVVDFFEQQKSQGFLTFGNDGYAGRIPKTSESLKEGNAFPFFPLIDCKQKNQDSFTYENAEKGISQIPTLEGFLLLPNVPYSSHT